MNNIGKLNKKKNFGEEFFHDTKFGLTIIKIVKCTKSACCLSSRPEPLSDPDVCTCTHLVYRKERVPTIIKVWLWYCSLTSDTLPALTLSYTKYNFFHVKNSFATIVKGLSALKLFQLANGDLYIFVAYLAFTKCVNLELRSLGRMSKLGHTVTFAEIQGDQRYMAVRC